MNNSMTYFINIYCFSQQNQFSENLEKTRFSLLGEHHVSKIKVVLILSSLEPFYIHFQMRRARMEKAE